MKNRKILFIYLLFISGIIKGQINVQIAGHVDTVYALHPNDTDSLNELLPLENLFKDKKIIGMGEATHGTKEFFNMKAKMFKFLATHCGYKVFSIEATYGGTLKVNDYVLYGKGSVLSAMKGMEFWTWYTDEVKDLIQWMRNYNKDKPDNEKLMFLGFDCQSFKGPNNALINYVNEYDSINIKEFKKGLSILNDSSDNYFFKLFTNDKKTQEVVFPKVDNILLFLNKWFIENENYYISKSGKQKFDIAYHNIENIKQTLLLVESLQIKTEYIRDSCMAQNIKWLSDHINTKVFAWAHNGHIEKRRSTFFKKWNSLKNMGVYLDDLFGKDYYNIGFVFNEGKFQAIQHEPNILKQIKGHQYKGLYECYLPPSPKGSIANIFSKTGIPSFFVDMLHSSNGFYDESTGYYNIGAVFWKPSRNAYFDLTPKKSFDGLIFVNHTQRAVPSLHEFTGK
jgi:erythromycin esterase